MLKSRLTYANVVATLALVFAMSGGALAANHYLITSTKQISPKVVKTLKGKNGQTGKAGATGAQGPQGAQGVPGSAGQNLTAETVLPSGHSESGAFSAAAGYDAGVGGKEFGWLGAGITYVQPLAAPIAETNIVDVTAGTATHCPGVGHADPGYLCLYDSVRFDVEPAYGYSNNTQFSTPSPGVVLYWPVTAAGEAYAGGEYTVTAP
ncbi:MAG: hypothetical protein WAN93_05760 [Solirubrobacteraceae bacterium]